MAAGAGQYLGAQLGAQAERLTSDPVEYFINACQKGSVAFLVSGAVMGVAAYYLKAASTAAMNNQSVVLGNIGTIFGNIQTPNFQAAGLGQAPVTPTVQGVQNFLNDAWTDVQAAGSDIAQIGGVIGTLGEDVGAAVSDVAKAMLAFVTHFPDILWNGVVQWIGGSIADILTFAFPWFLILGGALIVASLAARAARWIYQVTLDRILPRIELAANARSARFWNRVDEKYGTRVKAQAVFTQKSTEGMIFSANRNPRFDPELSRTFRTPRPKEAATEAKPEKKATPTSSRLPPTAEGKQHGPGVPPPVPPEPVNGPVPPPPEEISHEKSGGSGTTSAPDAEKEREERSKRLDEATERLNRETEARDEARDRPLPLGTPTAEIEKQLGEADAREPTAEELREAEVNRLATTPKEEKLVDRALAVGAELREAGYKDGREIYRAGSEARKEKAEAKLERIRSRDGEVVDAAVDAAKAEYPVGREEGQMSLLRGGEGPRAKTPRYRGAMESANEGMHPEEYGA